MGTSDSPMDRRNAPGSDPDSTLKTAETGGAAVGQIGPYRLLRLLGEGGMGEVWLAEQIKPLHRTVALKLIKAGMDTKAVVARFESERQALALMDHPNIAQVYDAGSTSEGRPYFAMEYVPGVPITEHCDRHRLSIKDRLQLFMQVCDGVQHAHQKAIIHRDLKPSNVLVVEQDNKAVPKIIDFGLAKATAQRLTDKTMFTALGVLMGTPAYMSPEQADLREQNIDTRTDVYSLGVILYELLVGFLPFETKALREAGLEAILRVIREQEPPKPSIKIRSMGGDSAATAEKRREEPRSHALHLQGELDWITMKALEKDRVRRYGSPSELSGDISRYLRSEPVVAGPATAGYRMRKYAARHRFALAAAAGILLLLIGFAATQAVELRRIARERDRANRIRDFMTTMFKVSDPSEARGNSITAREILDKASTEIGTGLTQDPELQAQMMNVMGDVYESLGLYSRAESLDRQSADIRRRVLGPEDPETLRSLNNLAEVLRHEGHFPEAEKLARESLDLRSRALGADHPDTLTSMNNLANVIYSEGHYPEAEKLFRETLDLRMKVLGPENLETLTSMNDLARVLRDENQYSEAEKLLRQTLDSRARVLGFEHPYTLRSKNNLANVLVTEGHYHEAEKLYRETLEAQRRVLGPEHPETVASINNLASVLDNEGQYPEAEKLDRETLELHRHILGPEHRYTMLSMTNLANVLFDEGHYAESEKLYREILAVQRRVLGSEHPDTVTSMSNFAELLRHGGHYTESEKYYKDTLDIQRRVLGPEHPDTASSTYNLACLYAQEARRDEALTLLRYAVDHGLNPSTDSQLDKDSDLKSLRGDPRFDALVAHAKQRAAAAQKSN